MPPPSRTITLAPQQAPKRNMVIFGIAFVLLAVFPTGIWWWQGRFLLELAKSFGEWLVPGTGLFSVGNLLYWLPILFLFAFGSQRAYNLAGTKYPGTMQEQRPSIGAIFPAVLMWYLIWIVIPIFLVKPIIGAVGSRLISLLPPELAIGLTQVLQAAGINISPDIAVQEKKSIEEQLCTYTKLDEKGNVISGGKQISVEVIEPPPVLYPVILSPDKEEGIVYRPAIKITNLAKDPLNVVVNKGEFTSTGARGSYVSGVIKKFAAKGGEYRLLTPLNCLQESQGCIIESGSERIVELITPDFVPVVGSDVSKFNLVNFDPQTFANLHMEVKVQYRGESQTGIGGKKGVGTGHLLIFPDKEVSTALQKDPNFKRNYCPNTFEGPLDVVVFPPFYTVGSTLTGGDGYFASPGGCPKGIKDIVETKVQQEVGNERATTTYCLQNIKTVKIKLVSTDKDAKIKLTDIRVLPFADERGDTPREYARNTISILEPGDSNCFYQPFGEGRNGVGFKDIVGRGTKESGLTLDSLPSIRTDATFLCKYQINDFPSGYKIGGTEPTPLNEFRDYQFKIEVGYDYILEVTKGNIPVANKDEE